MSARTHYDVLGVSASASPSEIKRAYLRLAKRHHPDATDSDSHDIFAAISHAYDVLKDPMRRRAYDGTIGTTVSGSGRTSSRAADVNANWRRGPSRDGFGRHRANSYTFDDDEDWDGNTAWTTAEIERRQTEERKRARAKADAARWWKHEKREAERRRVEFREREASATVRRSERAMGKISGLWVTRPGVVWQDIFAGALGVAALAYGASGFLRFASEKPPDRAAPTRDRLRSTDDARA